MQTVTILNATVSPEAQKKAEIEVCRKLKTPFTQWILSQCLMSKVRTVLLIVSLSTEAVMIALLHRTCSVHFVLQFNFPYSNEVSKHQPSVSKQTFWKYFWTYGRAHAFNIYNFFLVPSVLQIMLTVHMNIILSRPPQIIL